MPKLIEIIGSPGSGKTFLCDELEKIKKNNEKIFFHSSNINNNKIYKKLNFIKKNLKRLKVIFIVIFFCLIFSRRFFLKKIYKKKFFFNVILLLIKHFLCIEYLKSSLPNYKYLITEPGPIMYFLQDYFYINKKISKFEINIFNKFFLNTDFIVHLKCNPDLSIKRLHKRKRGLPIRMRNLNNKDIKKTIFNSIKVIDNYIKNSKNLVVGTKILKLNTTHSRISKSFKNNFLKN